MCILFTVVMNILLSILVLLLTVVYGQEGGFFYHGFNTYNTHGIAARADDQTGDPNGGKYAKYMKYDVTKHGDPEIALLNGHTQGWSEYLNGLYNIQSIEFLSAGSYPKAHK